MSNAGTLGCALKRGKHAVLGALKREDREGRRVVFRKGICHYVCESSTSYVVFLPMALAQASSVVFLNFRLEVFFVYSICTKYYHYVHQMP